MGLGFAIEALNMDFSRIDRYGQSGGDFLRRHAIYDEFQNPQLAVAEWLGHWIDQIGKVSIRRSCMLHFLSWGANLLKTASASSGSPRARLWRTSAVCLAGLDFLPWSRQAIRPSISKLLELNSPVADHILTCKSVLPQPAMVDGKSAALGIGVWSGLQVVPQSIDFGQAMEHQAAEVHITLLRALAGHNWLLAKV
jgi:hypothetical protein